MSAITQRSLDLVQIVKTLRGVEKASGSTLSVDAMPGYLVDAIRLSQSEDTTSEIARDKVFYAS